MSPQECPSGVVNEETFKHIYAQFFPHGDASTYAHYLFKAFDTTNNGSIKFEQGQVLSLYLTDPTATITDLQRAVVSSMSPPVGAAPSADGCTTQDYMHTDRYHDCPQHHVTVTKDCSGVVPDCHGVTQNGSGSSSVTSPALVLVETPNESVCGGTVCQPPEMDGLLSHLNPLLEDLVPLHLHPYRTICRNCVRMFKLHGMDYHRTPLGTSTAPYRDVWNVALAYMAILWDDISEFVMGLSTLLRGSVREKLEWTFHLYDINRDGFINKEEMTEIVRAIYDMMGKYTYPALKGDVPKQHVDAFFQ
ncbi:hypothetical protein NFI96_023475, partial [Prochilodus magdalenae]